MRYRNLGSTGLKVSEISFGTIPILSGDCPVLPYYFSPDEEAAIGIMEQAFKLGCNLFDTAIVPEYGDAEIKLGKFAAHICREKIIILDRCKQCTDMSCMKECPHEVNIPEAVQMIKRLVEIHIRNSIIKLRKHAKNISTNIYTKYKKEQ